MPIKWNTTCGINEKLDQLLFSTGSEQGYLARLGLYLSQWALPIAKCLAYISILAVVLTAKRRNTCSNLINAGGLMTCQNSTPWHPVGCFMHWYTPNEANDCMARKRAEGSKNNIIFLGDSRTRDLFIKFNQLFRPSIDLKAGHFDIITDLNNTRIEFLWAGRLFQQEWCYQDFANNTNKRPSLLISGTALWYLILGEPDFSQIKGHMHSLIPQYEAIKNDTKHLWTVQAPYIDHNKPITHRHFIHQNNANLQTLNKIFMDALQNRSTKLWHTNAKIAEDYIHENLDGTHWRPETQACATQTMVLLNYYCNEVMEFDESKCCNGKSEYFIQPFTMIHTALLVVCLLSMCIGVVSIGAKLWCRRRNVIEIPWDTWIDQVYNVVSILMRVAILLLVVIVSDRMKKSTFRESACLKESETTQHVFWAAVGLVSVAGMFMREETEKPPIILHQKQTAELKGWLQLVIIVYHVSGASNVLPRGMDARMVTSAYLFLCGYSHFSYYISEGRYPLRKFFMTLLRYNLLAVILGLLLGESYVFYSFIPVITLGFVTVYFVMAGWNQFDQTRLKRYVLMVVCRATVAVAAIEITANMASHWLVEGGASSKVIFHLQEQLHMLFTGVFFAMSTTFLKTLVAETKFSHSHMLAYATALLCLMAFPKILKYACTGEEHCNILQSFLEVILVVSYYFVRNAPYWLRSRYSYFFAWFGQISLEMYLLQHHLLQAVSKGRGRLTLVPGHPAVNFAITTFVFICVAHELHQLTNRALAYCTSSSSSLSATKRGS